MTETEYEEWTDRLSRANRLKGQITKYQEKIDWLENKETREIKFSASNYDDLKITDASEMEFIESAMIKCYTERIEQIQSEILNL
jgi:hypothetical protein